jgi:hypothetical protein
LDELDKNMMAILGNPSRLPVWRIKLSRTAGGLLIFGISLTLAIGVLVASAFGSGWLGGEQQSSSTLYLNVRRPSAFPDAMNSAKLAYNGPATVKALETVHAAVAPAVRKSKRPERWRTRSSHGFMENRHARGSMTAVRLAARRRTVQTVASPVQPTQSARQSVVSSPAPAVPAVRQKALPDDQHKVALEAYRKEVKETQAALAAYDADRSAYREELERTQRAQQVYAQQPHGKK